MHPSNGEVCHAELVEALSVDWIALRQAQGDTDCHADCHSPSDA
jgi:hypothetical protein